MIMYLSLPFSSSQLSSANSGLEVKKFMFQSPPPLTRCVTFLILIHQISVFWLFQILLSLSLNLASSPALIPPPQSSSFLLSLFLFQSSVSFSQLLHILSSKTSLRPHRPSILHPLWAEDTTGLCIWPQSKFLLPLFRMKHSIFCVIQTRTLSRMDNILGLGEGEVPIILYF